MEDTEEKNAFITSSKEDSVPLQLCRTLKCRFKAPQLELGELYQVFLLVVAVEMTLAVAILFMRDPIPVTLVLKGQVLLSINSRSLPVSALCILFCQYLFSYFNVISKGWGNPKSHFWCDIRIMYIQGFNSIRTSLRFVYITLLTLYAAGIVGMNELSSMVFVAVLSVIAVWQLGIMEMTNQYDTALQGKAQEFVTLEALQQLQKQRTLLSETNWSPMVIAIGIKALSWGTIFIYSSSELEKTDQVFLRTLILLMVTYTFILPLLCHFIYRKHLITFCELELHRMFLDVVAFLMIVTFALI